MRHSQRKVAWTVHILSRYIFGRDVMPLFIQLTSKCDRGIELTVESSLDYFLFSKKMGNEDVFDEERLKAILSHIQNLKSELDALERHFHHKLIPRVFPLSINTFLSSFHCSRLRSVIKIGFDFSTINLICGHRNRRRTLCWGLGSWTTYFYSRSRGSSWISY